MKTIPVDSHTLKIIAAKLRVYHKLLIESETQTGATEDLICYEIKETEDIIKLLREWVYA